MSLSVSAAPRLAGDEIALPMAKSAVVFVEPSKIGARQGGMRSALASLLVHASRWRGGS